MSSDERQEMTTIRLQELKEAQTFYAARVEQNEVDYRRARFKMILLDLGMVAAFGLAALAIGWVAALIGCIFTLGMAHTYAKGYADGLDCGVEMEKKHRSVRAEWHLSE